MLQVVDYREGGGGVAGGEQWPVGTFLIVDVRSAREQLLKGKREGPERRHTQPRRAT